MIYNLKKTVEIPSAEFKKGDKFYILVELFIKRGSPDNWLTPDWIREKTACKRLITKYTDFDFFYSLIHLQGKFNSLLGLISKKYHNLDNLYVDYINHKNKTKQYTLGKESFIDLGEPVKKARTINFWIIKLINLRFIV